MFWVQEPVYFCLFQKFLGVNIDGVEWKRDKFTRMEKLMLKINVKFATLFADIIILDSNGMKKYVSESFWKKTVYISYGVEEPSCGKA